MAKAKQGDKVKVHYTGKLDDGTVFDTSANRDPIEFTIGEQNVIPGFEKGVVGMEEGGSKVIKLSADEAYGDRRDEMIFEVERGSLPENIDPEVGQQLEYHQPDGQVVPLTVVDVSEANVKLDANHPLAGKDLVFDCELVEIVSNGE